ncbi:MAG: flagellar protein FlaG [Acidobacteriota bacterium]
MDISAINSLTAPAPIGSTPLPAPVLEERRSLIQAVRAVNAAELFGQENELSFSFDRPTGRTVVRIVDRKTREVVRQFPSEQVLRLAEELK